MINKYKCKETTAILFWSLWGGHCHVITIYTCKWKIIKSKLVSSILMSVLSFQDPIQSLFALNANSGPIINKYDCADTCIENHGKYDNYGMIIITNKYIK